MAARRPFLSEQKLPISYIQRKYLSAMCLKSYCVSMQRQIFFVIFIVGRALQPGFPYLCACKNMALEAAENTFQKPIAEASSATSAAQLAQPPQLGQPMPPGQEIVFLHFRIGGLGCVTNWEIVSFRVCGRGEESMWPRNGVASEPGFRKLPVCSSAGGGVSLPSHVVQC